MPAASRNKSRRTNRRHPRRFAADPLPVSRLPLRPSTTPPPTKPCPPSPSTPSAPTCASSPMTLSKAAAPPRAATNSPPNTWPLVSKAWASSPPATTTPTSNPSPSARSAPTQKLPPSPSLATVRRSRSHRTLTTSSSPDHPIPTSTVDAPVVFVGYGVTAPDQNYDDYKSLDVKGKIVAFAQGAPKFPVFFHQSPLLVSRSQRQNRCRPRRRRHNRNLRSRTRRTISFRQIMSTIWRTCVSAGSTKKAIPMTTCRK